MNTARDRAPPKPAERTIITLAALTLIAYGAWIYTFGVLLDDLISDLDTTEGTLVLAFGAAQMITGVGSLGAGVLMDGRGSRSVFGIGMIGAVVLGTTVLAQTPLVFSILFAIGGGTVGATGFYHISQTAVARLAPGWEIHAITRLTLYAAFSGPVFYPLTAWLVTIGGWQLGLGIPALASFVAFVFAWVVAPTEPTDHDGTGVTLRGFRGPARRYAIGIILSAGTIQLLSVYQVPVMVATGASLAAASTLAGGRGIAQFFGRLPLPRVIGRVGAAQALRGAILLLAIGTGLLIWSGSVLVAAAAMAITGVAIGAQSPLMGIRGREVFDPNVLGTALGTVTLGSFVAGGVAPILAGFLVDVSGSRLAAVILGVVITLAALAAVGGAEKPNQPR